MQQVSKGWGFQGQATDKAADRVVSGYLVLEYRGELGWKAEAISLAVSLRV